MKNNIISLLKRNSIKDILKKIIIFILDNNGRSYGQKSYLYYYFSLFFYYLYTHVYVKIKYVKSTINISEDNILKANELLNNGIAFYKEINSSELQEISNTINSVEAKCWIRKPQNKPTRFTVIPEKLSLDSIILFSLKDEFINAIEKYFGCIPTLQLITSWKNDFSNEALPEMYYHSDNHAFKFIKLFVFLSNVKHKSGHHEFIKKTHNSKLLKAYLNKINNKELFNSFYNKRNQNDNLSTKLIKNFFSSNVLEIYGDKGLVFMEDTSGLHRGTKIKKNDSRFLLQYIFTPYNNRRKIDYFPPTLNRSFLTQLNGPNYSRTKEEYSHILRLFFKN